LTSPDGHDELLPPYYHLCCQKRVGAGFVFVRYTTTPEIRACPAPCAANRLSVRRFDRRAVQDMVTI
jgi:hypothetical protein